MEKSQEKVMRAVINYRWIVLLCLVFFWGCAYRHYMGFHGPSIKQHPEIHADAVSDAQCLKCHDSDKEAEGPPTSHPHFTGCLKCHNDDIRERSR